MKNHRHPVFRASAVREHIDVKVILEINQLIDLLAIEFQTTQREEISTAIMLASSLRNHLYTLIHQRYDIIEGE